IVVDDSRSFAAEKQLELTFDRSATPSALSVVEVVLQVGIASANIAQVFERGLRKRRATKVGVQNDACCVDHAPKSRLTQTTQPAGKFGRDGFRQLRSRLYARRRHHVFTRSSKDLVQPPHDKRLTEDVLKRRQLR